MSERRLAPTIVVPCYNEAQRLDVAHFLSFSEAHPQIRFLMVDDGSTDTTRQVLEELEASAPEHFEALTLPANAGKAEAVRQGVVRVLGRGDASAVGFWDADLATPLETIPEFAAVLEDEPEVEVVLGARVKLLGRHVERNLLRHYFGRIAATAASTLLRLPVYDTQCGAKLFRVTPHLDAMFASPFSTRWAFDVEILARWLGRHQGIPRAQVGRFVVEVPLMRWIDVAGSKLGPLDFLRTPLDLLRIWLRYRSALR